MRDIFITITAGWLLSYFDCAAAASYYVDSADGQASDTGPGTMHQPWKTLARVGKASLHPGDTVSLRCGRIWREQLTLTASGAVSAPIVITSYGTCGTPPTLEGVDWLAGAWKRADDALPVYSHDASPETLQLLLFRPRGSTDARWLILAQHPNAPATGNPYLTIAETRGDTRRGATELISGPDLIVPREKSLVGARIHVRDAPWLIQQSTVTSVLELDKQPQRRISFSPAITLPATAGFGYFFDGLPWMLDSEGEWVSERGRLSVWLPGGRVPADGELGIGARRFGVDLRGVSHVVVDGLRIVGTQTAIAASKTHDVTIRRCHLEDTGDRAIDLELASDAIVSGCVIERTANEAVFARDANAVAVEDSAILDSGNVGTPRRGLGAVLVDNANLSDIGSLRASRVVNNVISGCGSICIRFGRRTLVADNQVKRSCVVLEDCGAIYAYNAVHPEVPLDSVVQNNIVEQVVGNPRGRPPHLDSTLVGIYLDNDVHGVQVLGNRVTDADTGILLHNAFNNAITGNVLHGIRRRGIHLSETAQNSRQGAHLITGNTVTGNEIQTLPTGQAIRANSSLGGTEDFGIIGDNRISSAVAGSPR